MTTLHRHVSPRVHSASRDLAVSWVALAFLVGLVALMPAVPTISEALGFDLEAATYPQQRGVLLGYVLVMDSLAAVAFVLGRRAVRARKGSALIPQVASVVIAGFFTLLMLAAVVGHLLGME